MAQNKNDQIAQDEVRSKVADLYQKLRKDAAQVALSTFGAVDPGLEKIDGELKKGKE